MKISILKESLYIGGTERSVSNISTALSEKNEVFTVLFNGKNMAYPYGGRLLDMKLPAKSNKIEKIINNFKRARLYKRHIREFKPDIVFQFVVFRSPICRIKLRNTVKIVSSRDFSALSQNISEYKKMLDTSDAMICNSCYLRDYFTQRYPEDRERVFAVHNIIDVNTIKEQSQENPDKDFSDFRAKHKKIIVTAGRFCKEKAYEHLISSFARVHEAMPDVGLVIIGDGEYKEKYMDIIKENRLDDVVYFTGYQKNPYKYMKKCDAFVLSSDSEGFPNVLAEAMALSLPVIACNCFTGPAEILMKNYDYSIAKESYALTDFGILTPHYSVNGVDFAVEEMAKAILRLLGNEELIEKYSKVSATRANDFSSKETAKKLETIFKLLKSRRC